MKLSPRESVLLLATAAAGLFGASVMLAGPKLDRWRELRREQARTLSQITEDRTMLAEGGRWRREFDSLRQMLPPFSADKKMDVHWLSMMDDLAKRNGLSILRRKGGEEKKIGDVYELPIECEDWEGRLEPLVHFLFDLQAEGAMLDIRQLLVKPKEGKPDDILRGRFTLYCAYTKEAAAPPATRGSPALKTR